MEMVREAVMVDEGHLLGSLMGVGGVTRFFFGTREGKWKKRMGILRNSFRVRDGLIDRVKKVVTT